VVYIVNKQAKNSPKNNPKNHLFFKKKINILPFQILIVIPFKKKHQKRLILAVEKFILSFLKIKLAF